MSEMGADGLFAVSFYSLHRRDVNSTLPSIVTPITSYVTKVIDMVSVSFLDRLALFLAEGQYSFPHSTRVARRNVK